MGFFYNYPRSEYRTLRQRARTALGASPTLLIPIVIVGSILGGCQPHRSGRRGGCGGGPGGRFVTREFSFATMPRILLRSAMYSAIVLFLVPAAAVLLGC